MSYTRKRHIAQNKSDREKLTSCALASVQGDTHQTDPFCCFEEIDPYRKKFQNSSVRFISTLIQF